jgi:quercetin dioxygenase-like cupin family protein
MPADHEFPRIVDFESLAWNSHPRFPGILMKALLTPEDNALANVSLVRVPPNCEVGRHRHPTQVETVFMMKGMSILTVGETEQPLNAGQIVAIPIGVEHGLRNAGIEDVELMAFFTPPL